MLFQHSKYNSFITLFLVLFAVALYSYFAYYLERIDFFIMTGLWICLFFASYIMIQNGSENWKQLGYIALLFRIIFLFATPNLSQDFYRFLWDGRLLFEGFNPYLSRPESWMLKDHIPIAQAQELYQGMGNLNGSHYTNYPPVSQFTYYIAALFSSKSIIGSVMMLRVLIIMADVGVFFLGRKLLKLFHLPEKRIFWYVLNPFIIIELTGNLHFEGIMIFFIIWSLYLLHKGYWYWAAVVFAISVSVKLIPLLFLPLFFQKFVLEKKNKKIGLIKLIGFYVLVMVVVVLTFAPFLSEQFLKNFMATIGLWFQKFEFNASIYFIARWIGYQITGWNTIAIIGKIMPVIVVVILIGLTFFRDNKKSEQLITAMLLAICVYYTFSTTVHPWYIAVPLVLCVFSKYNFPIIWSFVIVLSYSAYQNEGFKENLWLVALAYSIVFITFGWEMYKNRRIGSTPTAID